MRILYINKFFHIVGGVESYFFNLANLMVENGYQVAYFSMTDNKNFKSDFNRYFISNVTFDDISFSGRLKFLMRIFYSIEARAKIKKLLDEFKPDIVHLHDIYHQISPSILPEIFNRKIPIVQSIGNYHLIAPNYNLYHNGGICEVTRKQKYYKTIIHRCIKNSYQASLAEVLEKYFHNFLGWEKKMIKYFIVPSSFLKLKMSEYGIPDSKIRVIPHFTYDGKNHINEKRNYVLYFGRLTEEKGLYFLLNVFKELPHIKLKIAGEGILKSDIKEIISRKNLKNIELCGHHENYSLKKLISGSIFTILPSLWFEVFGLSVIESFALKRTVIASRIGGIPEIIKDGNNGILFNPGDLHDCKLKILLLINNERKRMRLEKNALKSAKTTYAKKVHYKNIISLYDEVIKGQS